MPSNVKSRLWQSEELQLQYISTTLTEEKNNPLRIPTLKSTALILHMVVRFLITHNMQYKLEVWHMKEVVI